MKRILPLLLSVAALSTCTLSAAGELSLIRGPLENTGVDPDAAGVVQSIFTAHNPHLKVRLSGLTAGATYQFLVNGINEGEFVPAENGRIQLRFDLNPSATESLLNFDPRGHQISINDGTAEVLGMVFSGLNEPSDIRVDERTTLERVDGLEGGRVKVRYLEQKNQDRFILHLQGLENAEYDLYVDGQLAANVDMTKHRTRMLVFALGKNGHANKGPHSKRLDLGFDPRGKVIDLVKDGVVVFSGEMLAKVAGINVVAASHADTTLQSTGADADATASAELKINSDGSREFSVSVLNLPVGDYVVVIGGVDYPLSVVDNAGVTSGLLEFSTDPHGSELFLNFDPAGMDIVIKQDATTFFTGVVNGTMVPSDTTLAASFELPLLNQQVVSGASGHVIFETDGAGASSFDVTLESLPAGNYDVSVGGVVKASIAVADNAGHLEGSVSFDTHPMGAELLLDFDPRGQLVTISQSSVVFLSRTLPQ